MSRHEAMADLVDLYALDALRGTELHGFERHLHECEICRSGVDFAHSVTASLVADTDPPQHVWDRIVAELEAPNVIGMTRRKPRARLWMTIGSIAAVFAFFVAGLILSNSSGDGGGTDVVRAEAESAATTDGATDVLLEADGVAVARIVVAADGRGFVIPTDDLPELDSDHTYQLWVVNDAGRVISAGVLGSAPGPSTFTWTDGVSGLALTREVAGGVEVSEGDLVAAITDI